ncbi:hypothetical protein [Pseudovibrio sp. Tun.PSC04-5.I4]|uniref:hypothetical protein n=1 Tax=Pseudovibrio sp. Tun.PSC04-5.I4 TaxID=1798213 RepID=UPI000885D50A|nr:hypothetical protein [Pseudovibrio sp. Tun.PSC04-5.I4]SDR21191.1 hypothetical protein SAMN04515695_3443 [Pseudovibrio sp. Tun.PSC04-5.I4]
MPELDDATSSNQVEVWIHAVFKECQLQWQEPAKEYQREEQESLKADDAKSAAKHIAYLRQKSKSTYAQRSEIEDKAKFDRALSAQLRLFDQAYVAVESNVDKAAANTDLKDINDAMDDAVKQLEFMRDALEAAGNSPVKNPEEAIAELQAKLEKAESDLSEVSKLGDAMEQAEKEEFDGIYMEAKECLDQSKKTLDADNFLEAEELLDQAQALMEDLQPGNSQDTAKRKKEYLAAIEDAKKTIKNLSAKQSTLNGSDNVKDFTKHKKVANGLIKHAETALKNGKVKAARPDIPKLKSVVEKIKECFKPNDQNKPTSKSAAKGKVEKGSKS